MHSAVTESKNVAWYDRQIEMLAREIEERQRDLSALLRERAEYLACRTTQVRRARVA